MIKVSLFVLLAVLLPTISANCDSSCPLDNLLNQKIKDLVSCTEQKTELVCHTALAYESEVSCPSGFQATGCSCGMRCGSWDIRANATCHCQCADSKWTSARCCKIALIN